MQYVVGNKRVVVRTTSFQRARVHCVADFSINEYALKNIVYLRQNAHVQYVQMAKLVARKELLLVGFFGEGFGSSEQKSCELVCKLSVFCALFECT